MTPTIQMMRAWFDEFNALVFDNELPKVKITFNNTYRQLGQFYWGPTKGIGIKISLFYERTEDEYRNCLLHEMCHLYCYHRGWKQEGHGPRWKAIANKAYRITGLYIQRCESGKDESGKRWEVSECGKAKAQAVNEKKNAPAIIVHKDYGTHHFIMKVSKNVLRKSLNSRCEITTYNGCKASVYVCDAPRAIKWSSSRSLHRGYKFSNNEFSKDIEPMLKKAIKVENLRDLCYSNTYDCLGIR